MQPDTGQQILHYRILQKLGEGGMGTVYLAADTKLHRQVALKFLPANMADDPERLRRFEREARTVAALNHPNIVTIYSVEEADGVPFIVMELVEGQPLTQLIPADGLSLDRIFELAIPIADAVSAAHDRGITHRDIKPGNIMVGNDGRVKVLDFGLAKLLEDPGDPGVTSLSTQTLTKTGSALGTVTYMAPEQLKGKSPDQRADIFSLGIVLYQMASGQRPFRGETSAEVISSILRDAPPPVTEVKLELPSHLGRIVKRCLEKNPNRRYQTAAELRNELEELRREVESGEVFEEEARTRAIAVPGDRKRKRHLAMLAAALVVVLLGTGIWLLLRAARKPAPPPPDAPHTLALLPFTTSGNGADTAFAEGLNEEMAILLTDLPQVQVVSRATARRLVNPDTTTREIGEALGADYLVLGSIRSSEIVDGEETARTTLEVVRVADDIQVWSESYDRRLVDELAVQSDVATRAVRGIGAAVLGLEEIDLPAEPQELPAEEIATGEETPPQPATERARPSAQTRPSASDRPAPGPARESAVVRIEETPSAAAGEGSGEEISTVELRISFETYDPEGVLTVYADDRQVLSREFRFERQKKGLLGRKRLAGSLTASERVATTARSIRVYLLLGNQTQLATLEADFRQGSNPRLVIASSRKGELSATLE